MNLNDLNIQKRIRNGDIREFERLFLKYHEPLCRHAGKILNDMDTAEDLVQEFFYRFWKDRESFTLKFSLNAYLYQAIRNNALHYLDHLAVHKNYAAMVLSEFREVMPANVQTDLDTDELNRAVNATLWQMPERCSRVFRMNRFEGKKYREIAEILSVSEKTVEADMSRALKMFRKSLRDYTGEGSVRRRRNEHTNKSEIAKW
ncbi:MAG: RNA polymerase sigma-70 factor [Bacteroidota bacterium]|jgi:RNA polymerase sigma-70 factor, ECF subfamily